MTTSCEICKGTGTIRSASLHLDSKRCSCSTGIVMENYDSALSNIRNANTRLRYGLFDIQQIRDAQVHPSYNELNDLVNLLREIETTAHKLRTDIGVIRENKRNHHKRVSQ